MEGVIIKILRRSIGVFVCNVRFSHREADLIKNLREVVGVDSMINSLGKLYLNSYQLPALTFLFNDSHYLVYY